MKSITIRVVDDLKILDRCLCDSTMEIKNIALCIVIPCRGFIVQFYQVVHVFTPPTF